MYINITLNPTHTPSDKDLEVNTAGFAVIEENNPTVKRPHGFLDYQLLYIESGCGYFKFEDKYEKISGKTAILFKPNEPQIYKHYKKDLAKNYCIHFSGTDV